MSCGGNEHRNEQVEMSRDDRELLLSSSSQPLGHSPTGVAYQISCTSDICIAASESGKITIMK